MLDEKMRETFVQLSADTSTQEFARQSSEKSDWIFTQIYQNFAKVEPLDVPSLNNICADN